MKRPKKVYRPSPLQYGLAIVFGMPFAAVGLIICITIIGIPLGILVMMIGAIPFYRLNRASVHWHLEQEQELEVYDECGDKVVPPWEDDALILSL